MSEPPIYPAESAPGQLDQDASRLEASNEIEGDLRRRAARGVVINSAFQIGFAGINLLRFPAAGFLTTEEFGVWGIMSPR